MSTPDIDDTDDTDDASTTAPKTDIEETDLTDRDGLHEEHAPTVRPALILLGTTLTLTMVVLVYLLTNPETFGEPQLTEIVMWVVLFVAGLVTLRLLIKIFVLQRMTYIITDTELRREYQLLYRRKAREVPIGRLRGVELTQGRIQSALGYGDVNFLTGGTNQSLGFVEFENVTAPDQVRTTVRQLVIDDD
jgi:uncharacterized membrane protein YdbT with pleckstrin-like domain